MEGTGLRIGAGSHARNNGLPFSCRPASFPANEGGFMSTLTKSILISIVLTVVLNGILWMSGCSVITLKV